MYDELSRLRNPERLEDIIGQPATRHLEDIVANPRPQCALLEGGIGIGKTTSAIALANELGCCDDMTGLFFVSVGEFGIDAAKKMFNEKLVYRYNRVSGFSVLILDELERLSDQCSGYLRSKLEPHTGMPRNLIVVATSNDSSGLDEALLERFRLLAFSSGPHFREACLERLGVVWEQLTGQPCLPPSASSWGVKGERFSMRIAIGNMTNALSGAARMQVA